VPGKYVVGRLTEGQRRGATDGPPVGQAHAVPAGNVGGTATTLCGITVRYVSDERFPPALSTDRPPVCEICWALYYRD
jgi:hypothetical protein